MKQETLKKAKDLEIDISEYSDLLRSRNASYGTMLIKISCAYANDYEDYHGRVDKKVWDKMLDVVADERRKSMQELEDLTDDSAESDSAGSRIAEPDKREPFNHYQEGERIIRDGIECECRGGKLRPTDKPCKASWKDSAVRTIDRLISWVLYSMAFCFLFGVAGLDLTVREIVAYSLMLGLVTGSINNIERVMRELFKKED